MAISDRRRLPAGDLPAWLAAMAAVGVRVQADAGLERQRVVALAPGARWATKHGPLANFGSVAGALHGTGYRIVTIGGPGEEGASASLARSMDTPPLDLSGRLSCYLTFLAPLAAKPDVYLNSQEVSTSLQFDHLAVCTQQD